MYFSSISIILSVKKLEFLELILALNLSTHCAARLPARDLSISSINVTCSGSAGFALKQKH